MRPGEALSQLMTIDYAPSENKHEDSFCYDFSKDELHLLSVFDGCGGLGSRRYSRLDNKTGAFIAAQSCARLIEQWQEQVTPELLADHRQLAESFMTRIVRQLNYLESKYADDNKLVGTMVRTMPCTASIALVHPGENGQSLSLTTLSAGDSRVYILTAENGLQQVTRDELRGNPDAMVNLYVSAPLSNVVNIDVPFTLQTRCMDMAKPFAVLAATDGVFGYVRTPMDFERILLDSLETASSFAEFESHFQRGVSSIAGDDATAVMGFYGWKSFKGMKRDFVRRRGQVGRICQALDANQTDEAMESAWQAYKPNAYI